MCLCAFAQAQSLYQLDINSPGEIVQSVVEGRSLTIVSIDDNRNYYLQKWNGVKWSNAQKVSGLPKHGTNPDGEFELTDLIVHQGAYFLCGNYTINTSGQDLNIVVSNISGDWKDLSDLVIRRSTVLHGFVELNDELFLVGKFRKGRNFNLLKFSGSEWISHGDLLTKNLESDFISDFRVDNGKIMIAGKFTVADLQSSYAIGELNEGKWVRNSLPPFIGEAYRFGNWNNDLVVIGKPHVQNDFIKVRESGNWMSLENGFEKFEVVSLGDIGSFRGKLFVSGEFIRKSDQTTHAIIFYSGSTWETLDWGLNQYNLDFSNTREEFFLHGSFVHAGLKNIARIGDGEALLTGTIFSDLNRDCQQQANEGGIANALIELIPGGHKFITDHLGRFQIPVSKGSYTIKVLESGLYQASCYDEIQESVTENKRYESGLIGISKREDVIDIDVDMVSQNGWTISKSANEIIFCITNKGTAILKNGKFRVSIPSWLDVSWSKAPSTDSKGLYWDLTNMVPDSVHCFTAYASNGSAVNGDKGAIGYSLSDLSQTDVNDWNNNSEVIFSAGEDTQPIFKQLGLETITNKTDKLNYHIGAQNVSGKTRGDIWIRDTLDEELYILRVREYASFPSVLKQDYIPLDNDNYQYVFTWIADESFVLSDSAQDVNNSKAFVQFELQLAAGYLNGDEEICNQAEVFFDNLEPLLTNEVCHEVIKIGMGPVLGLEDVFSIYPQPNSGKFKIENPTSEAAEFEVFNLQGIQIGSPFSVNPASIKQVEIKCQPGIYILRSNGYSAMRLLILQ